MAGLTLPQTSSEPLRRTRAGLLWRVVARAARTGDWAEWKTHVDAEIAAAQSPPDTTHFDGLGGPVSLDALLVGHAPEAVDAANDEFSRGLAHYLEALPVAERVRSSGRVAAVLHLASERTPLEPFAHLQHVSEGDQASIWDAVLRSLVAQQGDPDALSPWLSHLPHLPAALRPRWREQLLELDLPRATRERIDHELDPQAHSPSFEPDDGSPTEGDPESVELEPAASPPAPIPAPKPVFTDRETMPLPKSLFEASMQAYAAAKAKQAKDDKPVKPGEAPVPEPAFAHRETAELPRSLIEASLRAMMPDSSSESPHRSTEPLARPSAARVPRGPLGKPEELPTLAEDDVATREEDPSEEAARQATPEEAAAAAPADAAPTQTGTGATGPRMPRLAPSPEERGVEESSDGDPDLVTTQRELPVLRLAEVGDEEPTPVPSEAPTPAPPAEEPSRRSHRRRSRDLPAVAEAVELRGAYAEKPLPRIFRVLGVVTGLIVVAAVFRVLAHFALGWRRDGRLKLEEGRVTLDSTTFLLGREIRQVRRSFGPRGLLSVAREVRYPYFFLFLGLFALCLGTLAGTIAFLDGRLAGFEEWMRVGLLLILGGLLIDFIFAVVAASRPGRTTLVLTFEPRTTVRLIGVDQTEAERVLDLLTQMAGQSDPAVDNRR